MLSNDCWPRPTRPPAALARPQTTPRTPGMTPAVAPTERVCSTKASLVLDGDHYAVPALGLASLDTHGKDKAFVSRHKMCEFAYARAWNLGVFRLEFLHSVNAVEVHANSRCP